MKHFFLVPIGLFLCMRLAHAGDDYHCTVERIISTDWPASTQSYQEGIYLGKQFTVERNSGLMAGALKNSYATKPQVIDRGSKENSFKVVTTMSKSEGVGSGSNIYVLIIQEHAISQKKPFVFLKNDVVYTGACEHF